MRSSNKEQFPVECFKVNDFNLGVNSVSPVQFVVDPIHRNAIYDHTKPIESESLNLLCNCHYQFSSLKLELDLSLCVGLHLSAFDPTSLIASSSCIRERLTCSERLIGKTSPFMTCHDRQRNPISEDYNILHVSL